MIGTKIVGIFHNASYGVTYDTADAYVLGRVSAVEINYTAVEPVSGSLSGWRVIDHGPHVDGHLPRVQDVLTSDYISFAIVDRLTGARIAKIQGVRITGFSGGQATRQNSEISMSFKGMLLSDETVDNAESAGATTLP